MKHFYLSYWRQRVVSCICAATATAMLLSQSAHAETTQSCPPDHREQGSQPPAGNEWRCLDQAGQPDGPWLTWYDNGQLMSERQMKHGKEHGRQRSWWPNGQLMMEGISYEGNRYKGFKYWSINGEPTELNIETETVTKKADGTSKPDATVAPIQPQQSAPVAK